MAVWRVESIPIAVIQISDITPFSSKDLLDIQAATECRFSLNRVCDMIKTQVKHCFIKLFHLKQS